MATTITGKLNKPARTFQAGDSTGFGIRIGVKCRDPKTKEDHWTNYSAVIFAKSPGQIQFYTDVLVEGAVVEVSAEQLMIDQFDGENGPVLSIEMLNTRLGYVHNPQGQAPAQQNQGGYQNQQNPTYQQNNNQGQQNHINQQQQQNGGFNQQGQQQAPRDNQGFTQAQGGFNNNQQ